MADEIDTNDEVGRLTALIRRTGPHQQLGHWVEGWSPASSPVQSNMELWRLGLLRKGAGGEWMVTSVGRDVFERLRCPDPEGAQP